MSYDLKWLDGLVATNGPKYLAIADAIENAVENGLLEPGQRLPPHRTLCQTLAVDVTTVTRAYGEVKRRGLTTAEVGRGTFIRSRKSDAPSSLMQPSAPNGFIDLSHNFPATAPVNPLVRLLLERMKDEARSAEMLGLQADIGHFSHREAITNWLNSSELNVSPNELVITSGAQHGVLLAIHAVTKHNEVMLCESVTFYGALAAAKFLGRRFHPVDIDSEGILPHCLDDAFRVTAARTLYCMPTLHNPTAATMSRERREMIVAVCRKHDATIIEDDVYGFMIQPHMKTLCSLAPERTLYVSSFSKIVGPGLRVGFVRAPRHLIPRIGAGLRATNLMAPAQMVELVCQTLRTDEMSKLVAAKIKQVRDRQKWAVDVLKNCDYNSHPSSFHVWLKIGDWQSEAFAAAARERDVGVSPGALFTVNPDAKDNGAVRLCVSAASDKMQLQTALKILTDLVAEGPSASRAIV